MYNRNPERRDCQLGILKIIEPARQCRDLPTYLALLKGILTSAEIYAMSTHPKLLGLKHSIFLCVQKFQTRDGITYLGMPGLYFMAHRLGTISVGG